MERVSILACRYSDKRAVRRRRAGVVLAVSSAVLVAACGGGPNAGPSSPPASSAPSAAASIPATAASPHSSSSAGQLYSSAAYGWSIYVPRDWKLDDADPSLVKISPAPALPAGELGIHSGPNGSGFTDVDALASAGLASWEQSIGKSFTTVSRQHITLGSGVAAVEAIHLIGIGTVGKDRQIYVLAGGQIFILDAETNLDSWPTLEPFFDRIINSFTPKP